MRPSPLAFVIKFPDDAWPHAFAPVIELFLKLVFNHVALLFHHDDLVQTFGELADAFGIQRPDHAHLVDSQTELRCAGLINTQDLQRLGDIQVGLA
ncbi:hypothetical protein D3C75_771370 [compost metagenome]